LIHLLDSHPPPFDNLKVAWLFVPLVFLLLSFVYGVVKIPSLVNGTFTGRSAIPPCRGQSVDAENDMESPRAMPVPARDYDHAKREYLEQYGTRHKYLCEDCTCYASRSLR
jgi:hypothetical protein